MNPVELGVDLRFRGCRIGITLTSDFLGNCFGPEPFLHSHPKYELHAVTEGRCLFRFEGNELSCGEGEFVLIPPHLRHKVLPEGDSPAMTTTLSFAVQRDAGGDPVGDSLLSVTAPVRLPDRFGGLSRLMAVRRELLEKRPAYYEKICGELTCLLAELARALSHEQSPSAPPAQENRAELIEAYLAENYHDPACGCEALAKRLHLSPRQLHRVCVESFGRPFRELLTRTRMEVAAHRLQTTDLPVSVIAEQLGYSGVSAFSASYRRHFGRSPSRERK